MGKMIFACSKTPEEIVGALEKPAYEDNIKYTFTRENGAFEFAVTKIPFQLGKRRPVPYKLWFESGSQGLYLLLEPKNDVGVLKNASLEPEMYRFFIEKCGCAPAKEVC